MIDMGQFLALLKRRWIEKTLYTRASKKFSISVEELPPFMAPSVASEAVNTEIKKKVFTWLRPRSHDTGRV